MKRMETGLSEQLELQKEQLELQKESVFHISLWLVHNSRYLSSIECETIDIVKGQLLTFGRPLGRIRTYTGTRVCETLIPS